MAQSSFPQPGDKTATPAYVDAGPYTGDEWATLFRKLFTGDQEATQGALLGVDGEFAATDISAAPNAVVRVASGVGITNGHVLISTAVVDITIDSSGGSRTDYLCLVENNTGAAIADSAVYDTEGGAGIPPYSARLAVVKDVGTFPARYSQTNALYMVRLWTIDTGVGAINSITDERTWCIFATDIADDSVDDTKVGDRVPQFYRRQGGDATDWDTDGTTDYIPDAVRMQGGTARTPNDGTGVVTVTFPVAFSAVPIVLATIYIAGDGVMAQIRDVSTTTVSLLAHGHDGSLMGLIPVFWLAIGPE